MDIPSIYLNKILLEAAKDGAASLHLTIGSKPIMRVGGKLTIMEKENIIDLNSLEGLINSFVTSEDKKILEENKELTLVKNFADRFRFKANVFFQKGMPSLSFYYISENLKSLSDLNLSDKLVEKVSRPGLFIIAGPHFSGRTTTAAVIIEEINRTKNKYISTIEDPIEHLFVNKKSTIAQRQVGKDTISVIDGLRHCLDEDTDLVYVGEIKKDFREAIPLILDLASGNVSVILEVGANSVTGAIEKMLEASSSKSLESTRNHLADVLIGAIAQKLIPKSGGGLALAKEILLATQAAKSLIRENKILQLVSVMQTSRKEGMMTMEQSLKELAGDEVVKF
jgi:twitching motility protein PilT